MLTRARAGCLDDENGEEKSDDHAINVEGTGDDPIGTRALDDDGDGIDGGGGGDDDDDYGNDDDDDDDDHHVVVDMREISEIESTETCILEMCERDIDMKPCDDDDGDYLAEMEDAKLQRLKDMLLIENLTSL
jgi:hypothetical protein